TPRLVDEQQPEAQPRQRAQVRRTELVTPAGEPQRGTVKATSARARPLRTRVTVAAKPRVSQSRGVCVATQATAARARARAAAAKIVRSDGNRSSTRDLYH